MATIPCSEKVDCSGSDFPITNYSSEGGEQVEQKFSLYFPQTWSAFGCLSLCVSEVSQNDANLCALAQAAQCAPTPPLFCSVATTCSCSSDEGSEFFSTVPAGTFCAETQEAADALANAYACDVCRNPGTSTQLVGIDACTCRDVAYSSGISYRGTRPSTWIITDGSLPDGLTLNFSTGQITGTPTSAGIFSFTVRAFIVGGNYATKTMSITVIAITTTAITEYAIGSPYTFQMQATGGYGPYAWRINSGTLPSGLTMSLAGLISGTPTAAGVNPLVFQVIDTACTSDFAEGCTTILSMDESGGCGPIPVATVLAYYKCDDVAYPVIDYVSGNNLVDNGAGGPFPDVEPGIINTGFFGAASAGPLLRFGMRNVNAQWDLSGANGFTVRAWFWYSGASSTLYVTSISCLGAFVLRMFDPSLPTTFGFLVLAQGAYVHKHLAAIPQIGWNRVIAILRPNCGTFLKVNNQSTQFFPDAIVMDPGATIFQIEAPNAIFAYPKTGVDEVGVWRGAWSEAQMLYDWNGGAGRSYPDVPI